MKIREYGFRRGSWTVLVNMILVSILFIAYFVGYYKQQYINYLLLYRTQNLDTAVEWIVNAK